MTIAINNQQDNAEEYSRVPDSSMLSEQPHIEVSYYHSERDWVIDSSTFDMRNLSYLHKERLKKRGYSMGRKLGQGSFGDVYSVKIRGVKNSETVTMTKNLAAKISAQDETSNESGLFNEAWIMSLGGDCQNIISLIDIFFVQNTVNEQKFLFAYYLMPKAESSLHTYTHNKGPFEEEQAKVFFHDIANGLYFLHNKGIAHRDIKLQNILVVKSEQRMVAKLADFGLSKVVKNVNGEIEMFKKPAGTMSYMSPEIMDCYIKSKSGHKKDVKQWDAFPGDCWAAGICLYYLLTDEAPFLKSPASKTDRLEWGCLLLQKQNAKEWRRVPKLEAVSDQCRSMIDLLLEPKPDLRLNIQQVLNACWFKMQNAEEDSPKEHKSPVNCSNNGAS